MTKQICWFFFYQFCRILGDKNFVHPWGWLWIQWVVSVSKKFQGISFPLGSDYQLCCHLKCGEDWEKGFFQRKLNNKSDQDRDTSKWDRTRKIFQQCFHHDHYDHYDHYYDHYNDHHVCRIKSWAQRTIWRPRSPRADGWESFRIRFLHLDNVDDDHHDDLGHLDDDQHDDEEEKSDEDDGVVDFF